MVGWCLKEGGICLVVGFDHHILYRVEYQCGSLCLWVHLFSTGI